MAYYPQYTGYQPYYQGQANIINSINSSAANSSQNSPIVGNAPLQQTAGSFIVRPVASIEEAKAVPTDFTGAMTILTDFSHGAIYTKTLNYQDGTATFNCYRIDNTPLTQTTQFMPKEDYVPRKEFNTLREELQRLSERMNSYVGNSADNDRATNSNARKRRESRADDSSDDSE